MTESNGSEGKEIELSRFEIEDLNKETWNRLQGQFALVVRSIINSIADVTGMSESGERITATAAEDLMVLGIDFVKAKAQKPTLENAELQAEVIRKYAETREINARAKKIEQETKDDALDRQIRRLDMLLSSLRTMSQVKFVEQDGQSVIIITQREVDTRETTEEEHQIERPESP